MNVKFKIISAILLIFILASSFAGCGGNASIIETSDQSDNGIIEDTSGSGESESDTKLDNDNGTQNDSNSVPDVSGPNDNGSQDITSSDNSEGGKDVVTDNDSALAPIALASGGGAKYKIVSYFTSGTGLNEVKSFATELQKKSGATFTVSTDSSTVGGKQIVIGYSSKIMPHVGEYAFKSFTGGAAIVSGETVYISTASLDALPMILELFVKQTSVIEGTTYGIPADLKISADLCAISEHIPFFSTEGTASKLTDKGMYSAGGGNYQKTYLNMYAIDVKKYNDKLLSAGYVLKQSNTINSNSFYTFVKGDTLVHINWFAKLKQYSIVYGPKTYTLESAPITNYKKIATPSISQLALYHTGQSNVIQLEDGSFIVIDGGRSKSSSQTANNDSKILMEFLNSKKPASHAKPKVVWFYTHVHSDHINLSRDNFFPTYKDQIDLQLVCLNLPDFNELENHVSSAGWKEDNAVTAYAKSVDMLYDSIETNFPGTTVYTFHTGEKLYFAGCEVEILATPEDYYLNGFSWINDTSVAMKIKMQGKSFMVFGDCTAPVNDQMVALYGSYLKSDIIQVTHHGVGGATLSSVKPVDADICFWAVKEDTYLNDKRSTTGDAHIWLRSNTGVNGERKRSHYNQDYTTTVEIPTMKVTTTRWYSGDLNNRKYLG